MNQEFFNFILVDLGLTELYIHKKIHGVEDERNGEINNDGNDGSAISACNSQNDDTNQSDKQPRNGSAHCKLRYHILREVIDHREEGELRQIGADSDHQG